MDTLSLRLRPGYFVAILIIACVFTLNHAIARDTHSWKETLAKFEFIEVDIATYEPDTLLDMLVKQTGKSVGELLESDKKTLLTFSIKYCAPVKLKGKQHAEEKPITQYGLYRTLAPVMQSYFKSSKNREVKIRFALSDPVLFEFIVNKKTISAPVLLTDIID